jgi:hypothetical protein
MKSFKIFESYEIDYDQIQIGLENNIGIDFDDLDTIVTNIIDFEKTLEKSIWIITVDKGNNNFNRSSLFQVRETKVINRTPNISPVVKSAWNKDIDVYLRYVYQFEILDTKETIDEYAEQYRILKDRGEQLGFTIKAGYAQKMYMPHISFTQKVDNKIFQLHSTDHDKLPKNIIVDFENYCARNILNDKQRSELVDIFSKI